MIVEGTELGGKVVAIGAVHGMTTETAWYGFLVLIIGFCSAFALLAFLYWSLAAGIEWAERQERR